MANCPHCDNKVPYFGRKGKDSLILENLFRGDNQLYTCQNCNYNYCLSLGRRWLPGVFAFSFFGFIMYLCDKIPALIFILDHIEISLFAFVLIIGIGDYIWWRYFTQLEAEY